MPVPNEPNAPHPIQLLAATDSAVPNFQGVNAAGEPLAEFEGKLIAKGLELFEATGVNESANNIQWKNAVEGFVRELIVGLTNVGRTQHSLTMQAIWDIESITKKFAELDLITSEAESSAVVSMNGTPKTIFNSAGKSHFLQLLIAAKVRFNTGLAELVFTGTNTSNVLTISHGLGATPLCAFVQPAGAGLLAGNIPACDTFSYGGVTFQTQGDCRLGTGPGNIPVAWIAFG